MEGTGNYRQVTGKEGEDAACDFLRNMGHTILERNWRSGHLEIDIISVSADGIHFVEVKARRENIQAPPQENVGRSKQRKIVTAAHGFLRSVKGLPYGSHELMFDVIAVTFTGGSMQVEWFPQAYIPFYI